MPDRKDLAGREAGNYRLIQCIGSGGFAEVYLGEHIYLRSPAAIKVLHASLDPAAAQNFRREARILRKLRHPNIISLLDFGVDEQGRPYLIMDYAPGGSLRERYPKGTRVPLPEILKYVHEAASALDYAHNQGFVHRDIKPANMLIGENGEILLSDFGIATIAPGIDLHTSDDSLWRRSFPGVAGTPAYMALEQLEGRAEPASDQYALATIVYQWLCGALPFDGKSWMEIAARRASSDPPPLRDFNPAISTEIEDVVLTGLARNPRHRYASVRAFADALIEAAQPRDARGRINGDARDIGRGRNAGRGTGNYPPAADSQPTPAISINRASTASRAAQRVPGVDARFIAPPHHPTGAQLIDHRADETKPVPTLLLGRRTILAGMGAVIVAAGAGFALTHLGPRSPVLSHASAQNQRTPGAPHATTTPTAQKTQGTTPAQFGTLYEFHQFADTVSAVAWLPKTTLISAGCYDDTAQIWNIGTGSTYTLRGHSDSITSITWSPDGKRIATGSVDKTVRVWDAINNNPVFIYSGHSARVYAVTWSPDGKYIASGGADNTVQVWDAKTGITLYTYTGHSNWVRAVEWSPDGIYIASGSHDNTVQVWNPITRKLVYKYSIPGTVIYALAWSPDGKRIASGNYEGVVNVWNAFDGGNSFSYTEHSDSIFAVAWSPDGTHIASGSADQTARVWNASDGSNSQNYRGHHGIVDALAWSSDSTRIASGSADKSLQIWQAV